jgi:hypothetical protein
MKKTKLYKRRLELLEECGEVHTSKKGSKYTRLESEKGKRSFEYQAHNVTKGTISKINSSREFEGYTKLEIILLTESNKLMIKTGNQGFQTLGVKRMRDFFYRSNLNDETKQKVCNLVMHNRRAEWVKDMPQVLPYFNLAQSFHSKQEFLDFLGCPIENPTSQQIENLINGYKFKNKQGLIEYNSSHNIRHLDKVAMKYNKPKMYKTDKSFQELMMITDYLFDDIEL